MYANLSFFNRLSYNSHSTTLWCQISYQYRYYIHLHENQPPNRAALRLLPSVVQAVSGLTLNRGSPELRIVLGQDETLLWEWEIKTQQIEKIWLLVLNMTLFWLSMWIIWQFIEKYPICIHLNPAVALTGSILNGLGKTDVEKNLLQLGERKFGKCLFISLVYLWQIFKY